MNNITTGIEEIPPTQPPTQKEGFLGKIEGKIPSKIRSLFAKFYAKKIFFWPVTITFGLLFLIIILGIIFGKGAAPAAIIKATPTPVPFVLATPSPCTGSDPICQTENTLMDLNGQINSLDIKQNRLLPPQIDYNISF